MEDGSKNTNAGKSSMPKSLFRTGIDLIEGKNGVRKNYSAGMRIVLMAAESGSSEAKFYLGALYNEGKVVSKDPNKSLQWIQAAAEEELSEAQWWLADYYSESGENNTSLVWRTRAAINGDSDSQVFLAGLMMGVTHKEGLLFATPDGHFQLGIYWLQEAAKQNHGGALFDLGALFYKSGQLDLAYNHYFSAAALMSKSGSGFGPGGGARPHYNLGLLCEESGDLKQACSWFYFANNLSEFLKRDHAVRAQERVESKLSDNEVLEARDNAIKLAYELEKKRSELLKDWRRLDDLTELANSGDGDAALEVSERFCLFPKMHKRREFLAKAANCGSTKAMMILGNRFSCPAEGLSEEERIADQIRWLEMAASKGEPEAMYELFRIGRGWSLMDIPGPALAWLNKAAESGYAKAQLELGEHILSRIEKAGEHSPEDIKAALDLIRQAADAEEGLAQLWLGRALYKGNWIETNHYDALVCLIKASRNGHSTEASHEIGMIYLYGKDVERNPVEGLAWLKHAGSSRKDLAVHDKALNELNDDQKKAALNRAEEIRKGFYNIES